MTLEQIADLIHPGTKKVKAGRERLNIQCIAHEDNTPSLTIWHDTRGKLALNCQAGCTHDQIVAKLPAEALDYAQTTWGIEEPKILIFPSHKPQTPQTPDTPGVEAEYPYVTEDGELAYLVRRHPGKKIRQYHQNGDGQLVAGRGPADLIPYRLPDVLAANRAGDTIHIVEGEKDADNLATLGLTATCNVGGAGKWTDNLAGWFAGAHVVILADNDQPGTEHALDVSLKLDHIAETVQIVTLPNLPDKGDVTDWIEAGGTAQQLMALVDKSRKAERGEIAGVRSLDLTEVLTGSYSDEHWLVEPLLPRGRQISLYAQGKSGKSLIALEIACALASGRPSMLEDARPPMHVVYIDFEMTPGDLQERLIELGYDTKDSDFGQLKTHLHYYLLQPFDPLDTKAGGNQLMQVVEHHAAALVVLDTLIRSVEGEENSSDTIKNFNRYTGQRIKSQQRTLLRVDHAGKDATRGQRGSSAKRDDVDLIWRLKLDTIVDGKQTMRLINDASRMAWVDHELQVTRHDDPLRHEIHKQKLNGPQSDAYNTLNNVKADRTLSQNGAWNLVKHLSKETGFTKRDVEKAQKYRKQEMLG